MKTITSLAIATLSFIATPAVQAHDHSCGRRPIIVGGFGVSFAPRYLYTKEVCRRIETRWVYDSFGHLHASNVLVITYADYYSDGSARSYVRTYFV